MIVSSILCALASLTMTGVVEDTKVQCISVEAREAEGKEDAVGWYNGDTDIAYVVEGLGFSYTRDVLWHELAHAWDLKKGTELNGFPSFFSETHTGFDVESFARLQTLYLNVWPIDEVYPDRVPTEDEWSAMETAGWFMDRQP